MRFQISLFPMPKKKPISPTSFSEGIILNASGASMRTTPNSMKDVMIAKIAVQTNFGSKGSVGSSAFFVSQGRMVLTTTPISTAK